MNNMLNAIISAITHNLITVGQAMLIFLCAYLANVFFALYLNIRLLKQPFEKKRILISLVKVIMFAIGLSLLIASITTLPIFAQAVGWAIPEEYAEVFDSLIIISAILYMTCRYALEAFGKFKTILKLDKVPEEGPEISPENSYE